MSDRAVHPLEELMRERIAILDGAMGTMIQRYGLSETDYRGTRFHDWKGKDLKGSLELLLLTKPAVIDEIHTQYLEAGADLIETNTFSATTIGLHDFLFQGEPKSGRKDAEFFQRVVDDIDLCNLVHEINLAAARSARASADRVSNATGQRRFVVGSMGPLPVTASLSPDVNDPSFRAVTFDQIEKAYAGQAAALLEGDVDLLAVETIFDTLNAKAAISAITQVFERAGKKVPLIISGTVTDLSGRILSGQTVEAFLISVAHADPLILSLNCALGPNEMEPYIEELARSRIHLHLRLSKRRSARSAVADRLSRNPRKSRTEIARVGEERLAEHRRGLLRHHARSHPRDRHGGSRISAARRSHNDE